MAITLNLSASENDQLDAWILYFVAGLPEKIRQSKRKLIRSRLQSYRVRLCHPQNQKLFDLLIGAEELSNVSATLRSRFEQLMGSLESDPKPSDVDAAAPEVLEAALAP
jgi:hypothetical protein